MRITRANFTKTCVYGIWLGGLTWLFFGPVAAFHGAVRFGVTAYLIFNGEERNSNSFIWQGFELMPSRLAVALLLWALSIFLVYTWLRYLDSNGPAASE
jgi:hypothetical protein